MTSTKLQKWGNSFAVRLPKASVRKLGLRLGQSVVVLEEEHGAGLRIVPKDPPINLSSMVNAITPNNRHSETGWGSAAGKEIW